MTVNSSNLAEAVEARKAEWLQELRDRGHFFASELLRRLETSERAGDLRDVCATIRRDDGCAFTALVPGSPFFSEFDHFLRLAVKYLQSHDRRRATRLVRGLAQKRTVAARPGPKESREKAIERQAIFLPPAIEMQQSLLALLKEEGRTQEAASVAATIERLSKDEWPEDPVLPKEKRPMDLALFWEIIDKCIDRQSRELDYNHLRRRLTACGKTRIVKWNQILRQQITAAAGPKVFAVGYAMNGGLSDDTWDYFLAWIVSQGREFFEAFVVSPEKTALEVSPEGNFDAEELLYIAEDAIEELGQELPEAASRNNYGSPALSSEWSTGDIPVRYRSIWERFNS